MDGLHPGYCGVRSSESRVGAATEFKTMSSNRTNRFTKKTFVTDIFTAGKINDPTHFRRSPFRRWNAFQQIHLPG
jgi:hypothetical protein